MAICIKAWLSPWCTWQGEVSLLLSLVLIAILAGQEALLDELYQDLDDAIQEENTENTFMPPAAAGTSQATMPCQ